MLTSSIPSRRIGFVSTRFGTKDGVSLETQKWAHVLKELGHQIFYFAGLCDPAPEVSYVVPEPHFDHPEIRELSKAAFRLQVRPFQVTRRMRELQWHLKQHLYRFIEQFQIELLIVENALSIPMNIPLGLALTELIAETGKPTIGHHHDFSWERKRFLINCVGDYLDMSFPPRLPTIRHVVINSLAANQIARRKGVGSVVIPNVMDFDHPPPCPTATAALAGGRRKMRVRLHCLRRRLPHGGNHAIVQPAGGARSGALHLLRPVRPDLSPAGHHPDR